MDNVDLVYPLRSVPADCEELRYSLRSVCENLPHRNVFIVGEYMPKWINTDKVQQIKVTDGSDLKAPNVAAKIYESCLNEGVSDPFILMNDDFYVLQKMKNIPFYALGTIYDHLAEVLARQQPISEYARSMARAGSWLKRNGCTDYDFGAHCPIVVHKNAMIKALDVGYEGLYLRAIYGNMIGPPTIVKDFKYRDVGEGIDMSREFASTTDSTFRNGLAGVHIRERFKKPCIYERRSLGG